MFKKIRKVFSKYKIKAKKLYTIIMITILEIIMILWWSNWVPTPAILAPLFQFVMIFENRKGWNKLSEEEKKELTLTEEDLDSFVTVIAEKLDYMSLEDILKELKK